MFPSLAHAVIQLAELDDGTHLQIGFEDGQLRLEADGMAAVKVPLPAGDLVLNDEVREQLRDVTILTYHASRTSPAAFMVCASLMAADRAGAL